MSASKAMVTFAIASLAVALATRVDAAHAAEVRRPASESGRLGGAPFRIDIPAHWNGELVMLAHGFEPVGVPRATPWPQNEATPVFLSAGYAVAQSGYAAQGWAIREGMRDTETLRRHFVARNGAPHRTWLVGFSMGGAIAVANLEQQPAVYDGALSLCGANVPGSRLAEELFTTLVAFDVFFPGVQGMPAGGLSDPKAAGTRQVDVMNAAATALEGNPQATAKLAAHLGVPAEALPGVISLHHMVFQDMLRRAGGMPVDNRNTVYAGFGDDGAFNAAVRRYTGDAAAMRYIASAPALTGRVRKPLVLQYNVGDPTVAARWQPMYAGLATAAGASVTPATLPPAGEGHCGFSPEQMWQAFKALTGWGATGKRPVE